MRTFESYGNFRIKFISSSNFTLSYKRVKRLSLAIMLIFIGDVHGEFKELEHRLNVRKIRDSVFVQVGDFGVGFYHKESEINHLNNLNECLKQSGNTMYVIRGNHDDPAYFDGKVAYSNLVFLRDYSVLELKGYTLLLIGGAISIDRAIRIQGRDYWKDEEFVFDTDRLEAALKEIKNVDIVVTHTAPSEFWPFEINNLVRSYASRDDNLILDLARERESHSKLLKHLTSRFTPTHWYYGHFHTIVDGEYNNLKYYVLGESEFREHRSKLSSEL